MTKNRFGNGGSRGGRSARGKRRNEAQRAASHASGDTTTGDRAGEGDGTVAMDPDAGAGDTGHANSRVARASANPASTSPTVPQAQSDAAADVAGDASGVAAVKGGDGAAAATDQPASAAAEAEQLEQLQDRIATLQDELLRKQADFENFRKRINRDKEEAIKFANSGLLLDLTAVLDDFERAISAAARSEDFATLHSGIELIEKQLLSTLQRKWGLTRFDSAGQPFDPERHEALATEPSAEHAEATVVEDYQKGYTLHGRVIRAARVRVATPLERAADSGSAAGNGSAADTGSAAHRGSAAGTEAGQEEGA